MISRLIEAANNNSRISVVCSNGRVFRGQARSLQALATGMVFVVYSELEGYNNVNAESIVAIHAK